MGYHSDVDGGVVSSPADVDVEVGRGFIQRIGIVARSHRTGREGVAGRRVASGPVEMAAVGTVSQDLGARDTVKCFSSARRFND